MRKKHRPDLASRACAKHPRHRHRFIAGLFFPSPTLLASSLIPHPSSLIRGRYICP